MLLEASLGTSVGFGWASRSRGMGARVLVWLEELVPFCKRRSFFNSGRVAFFRVDFDLYGAYSCMAASLMYIVAGAGMSAGLKWKVSHQWIQLVWIQDHQKDVILEM